MFVVLLLHDRLSRDDLMTLRLILGAAVLTLGLQATAAQAQYLQPGMRTMIQQGGVEPGPLLGAVLPGYGYAPYGGFVREDDLTLPEEGLPQRIRPLDTRYEEGTPVYRRTVTRRRFVHKRTRQASRHHFAR